MALHSRIGFAAGLLCLAGSAALAAGNPVKDGSFEKPQVSSGTQQFVAVGDKVGPWKVIGTGNVGIVGSGVTQNGFTLQAKNGLQFVNLAGNMHATPGLQQTIKTVPGTAYMLTFNLGSIYDPDHGMGTSSTAIVKIDGKGSASYTVFSNKNKTDVTWGRVLVGFTATGSKTEVQILSGDAANDSFNGVDGVSVSVDAAP